MNLKLNTSLAAGALLFAGLGLAVPSCAQVGPACCASDGAFHGHVGLCRAPPTKLGRAMCCP